MQSPVSLSRTLVLASASPRRAALLQQLGLSFITRPAHLEEPSPEPGEDLLAWARQAATEKAQATARLLDRSPALVLGADTVVALPGGERGPRLNGACVRVLGKPSDASEARAMLHALAGRTHQVVSAFALVAHPEGAVVAEVVQTAVEFFPLTTRDIDAHLATGEPLDKAGAYGIQGRGAVLVAGITGDYYAIVGLPLARLWQCLAPWRV